MTRCGRDYVQRGFSGAIFFRRSVLQHPRTHSPHLSDYCAFFRQSFVFGQLSLLNASIFVQQLPAEKPGGSSGKLERSSGKLQVRREYPDGLIMKPWKHELQPQPHQQGGQHELRLHLASVPRDLLAVVRSPALVRRLGLRHWRHPRGGNLVGAAPRARRVRPR